MPDSNTVEILPGLYQIRLPIPIKSLGSVFVYLIREKDHNLLIDTGWNSEESYIALRSAFSSIGFTIPELESIIISHLHPDHFGLSARLKHEAPNAKVMMHHSDAAGMRTNLQDYQRFMDELSDFIRIHGAPEPVLKEMMNASIPFVKFINPAKPDIQVYGGEIIRLGDKWKFEIIPTPGHTAGNLCLYDKGESHVFFSGDHVLPTITPNVSLTPLYKGDPLGDYLESLESLKELNVTKVLPSHEYLFTGLGKRLDEIELHHKQRLQDTVDVLTSGKKEMSAYEVAGKLHWYTGSWEKLTAWEKRAAVMETLAHLEYLKRRGKIAEIEVLDGGKPRYYFSNLGKA